MAKLPFAQAPSMGLNAFFAFTLCQGMGFTWQQSLAALLVEGLIFLLITFFNVRELILKSIPTNLSLCNFGGHWNVHSLYWFEECRYNCGESCNYCGAWQFYTHIHSRNNCHYNEWCVDGSKDKRLPLHHQQSPTR